MFQVLYEPVSSRNSLQHYKIWNMLQILPEVQKCCVCWAHIGLILTVTFTCLQEMFLLCNISFLLTSRPPTSSRRALCSNQPCFHRNRCLGNADSGSLHCRKNPKLTTPGPSVRAAKDRATTRTSWGEGTCVCVCEREPRGGVIKHDVCVCVCGLVRQPYPPDD